jgi:hypothetical protein
MKNANEIKFRCSSLGYIMPGPKEKPGILAKTVITNLVDIWVSAKYGRREEIKNKFLDKGNACEEDSITLLSRVKKIMFKKNSERLENLFVSGEPDIFTGESIKQADEIFDTKTSWSAHTFFRAKNSELDDNYFFQGHGYMYLTGAKKHTVAYCLVNGTAQAIEDEKRRLGWQMGVIDQHDTSNEAYKHRCKQIEINHIFDLELFKSHNPGFDFHNDLKEWKFDIPKEERVHSFTFERDEQVIEAIIKRVVECRQWINTNLFEQ